MRLSLIVAMDRNGLIGDHGTTPWFHRRDLSNFRNLTIGKPVIMGRRTFDAIGNRLPHRPNIVLTRRKSHRIEVEGVYVASSANEAIGLAEAIGADEAFVIGGAEVYREFLPLCTRAYVTTLDAEFEGDAHFPASLGLNPAWKRTHVEGWEPGTGDAASASYVIYDRVSDDPLWYQIFNEANRMRQAHGVPKFKYDVRLEHAAQMLADRMVADPGLPWHDRLEERLKQSSWPVKYGPYLTRADMQVNYSEGVANSPTPITAESVHILVSNGPRDAHYMDFYDPKITHVGIGIGQGGHEQIGNHLVLDYGVVDEAEALKEGEGEYHMGGRG